MKRNLSSPKTLFNANYTPAKIYADEIVKLVEELLSIEGGLNDISEFNLNEKNRVLSSLKKSPIRLPKSRVFESKHLELIAFNVWLELYGHNILAAANNSNYKEPNTSSKTKSLSRSDFEYRVCKLVQSHYKQIDYDFFSAKEREIVNLSKDQLRNGNHTINESTDLNNIAKSIINDINEMRALAL